MKAIAKGIIKTGIITSALMCMNISAVFASDADAPERIIAHGGGSYRGYETTNSVEAVNNAIQNGYKLIELDMELSSDNKIVMIHDWDRTMMHYYGTTVPKKLSQSQFMKLSVYGQLEVLNIDMLAEILAKNKEIRIVTDTKGDNLELLTGLKEKYPDLIDRFIPQIYEYDQLEQVKALGYSDVILTLYAMADPDIDRVASFAKEHGIYAVTMPDYMADKGYCSRLASRGITTYVHPVSDYEDAIRYMKQGACGVYSGTLLPEEFTGIEKDYYLVETGASGSAKKLDDARIKSLGELKIQGLKTGEAIRYTIDNTIRNADEAAAAALNTGKHSLTVDIVIGRETKGSLVYFFWKDESGLRIVHKKYEYRLDEVRTDKDFGTVMNDAGASEKAAEILRHSLVAKAGESSFYFEGETEHFLNGEELLPVQKGSFGKLLTPLYATLKMLGADSVIMSSGRDITIVCNGEKSMIMAESSIIRRGFMITRLNQKVTLYLNKAMAGGEFYQNITGRNYVEGSGLLIILPEGQKTDTTMEKELLYCAGKLF